MVQNSDSYMINNCFSILSNTSKCSLFNLVLCQKIKTYFKAHKEYSHIDSELVILWWANQKSTIIFIGLKLYGI